MGRRLGRGFRIAGSAVGLFSILHKIERVILELRLGGGGYEVLDGLVGLACLKMVQRGKVVRQGVIRGGLLEGFKFTPAFFGRELAAEVRVGYRGEVCSDRQS